MSASEIGQRAANGAEYAPNMPFEHQKMSSSENPTGNGRVSGSCADLPLFGGLLSFSDLDVIDQFVRHFSGKVTSFLVRDVSMGLTSTGVI
jgi:hypothetical protein